MRTAFLFLSLMLSSCKPITIDQVRGKWYTFDDQGNYMELWISDTLALSYLSSVNEFQTYKFQLERDEIRFQLVESYFMDTHEFTLRIEKLKDGVLLTKYLGQTLSNPEQEYHLISGEMPVFYPDLESNEQFLVEARSRIVEQ